jgi:ankyrin repeat protein
MSRDYSDLTYFRTSRTINYNFHTFNPFNRNNINATLIFTKTPEVSSTHILTYSDTDKFRSHLSIGLIAGVEGSALIGAAKKRIDSDSMYHNAEYSDDKPRQFHDKLSERRRRRNEDYASCCVEPIQTIKSTEAKLLDKSKQLYLVNIDRKSSTNYHFDVSTRVVSPMQSLSSLHDPKFRLEPSEIHLKTSYAHIKYVVVNKKHIDEDKKSSIIELGHHPKIIRNKYITLLHAKKLSEEVSSFRRKILDAIDKQPQSDEERNFHIIFNGCIDTEIYKSTLILQKILLLKERIAFHSDYIRKSEDVRLDENEELKISFELKKRKDGKFLFDKRNQKIWIDNKIRKLQTQLDELFEEIHEISSVYPLKIGDKEEDSLMGHAQKIVNIFDGRHSDTENPKQECEFLIKEWDSQITRQPLVRSAIKGKLKERFSKEVPIVSYDNSSGTFSEIDPSIIDSNFDVLKDELKKDPLILYAITETNLGIKIEDLYPDPTERKERIKIFNQELKSKNLDNLLALAIKNNNEAIFNLLIQQDDVLEQVDSKGIPVIELAFLSNNVNFVKKLLERGCKLSQISQEKLSPLLSTVIKYQNPDLLTILLEHDYYKEYYKNPEHALQLFNSVFHFLNIPLFKTIGKGIKDDINYSSGTGEYSNILELIVKKGVPNCKINPQFIEILMQANADPNIKNKYGETALMIAVNKKATSIICILLRNQVNLDIQDSFGNTALMIAVKNGDKEIIKVLLDNGANLDIKNKFDDTAIMIAVKKGNIEIINDILTKRSNLDIQNADGQTALMIAVYNRNTKIINALLEKGANLDIQDIFGETNLMIAVYSGDEKIINALLEKGANLDTQNAIGDTALMLAVKKGDKKIINALLDKGAKLDIKNKFGDTALMLAFKNGDKEIINAILAKRPNLDIQNADGETPLILSIKHGFDELALKLLQCGANSKIYDNSGQNALFYATRQGNLKMFLELFQHCDEEVLNHQDVNKFTILMNAVLGKNPEIFNFLIDKQGLNINARNNLGHTALMIASSTGQHEFVDKLKDVADINIRDNAGQTALMMALKNSHNEVASQLLNSDKIDLNLQDNDGETALMIAVKNDNDDNTLKMVQDILKRDFNVNIVNKYQETALIKAIKTDKSSNIVDLLLQKGAPLIKLCLIPILINQEIEHF